MTSLSEKTLFQRLVTAENCNQIRPNDDDGWRTITPPCREFLNSRAYQKTKALGAIPAGTIIGPVIEVHVVKILESMD